MRDTAIHSLGVFAAELGMTRDVLRRILAEAGVGPVGKRGGHPVYRLRDVYQAVVTQFADPENLNPHARLALAKAILTEDLIKVRRREWLDSVDVERHFFLLFDLIKRWAETVPDILERDCGLSGPIISKIEDTLSNLQDELAGRIEQPAADAAP